MIDKPKSYPSTEELREPKRENVKFGRFTNCKAGNKTKNKTRFIIRFVLVAGIFVFALVYNEYLMQTKIDVAYISTVINGITASTSIVLGFAGIILGLLYREIFKNDEEAKTFLFGIAVIFSIPIFYLYSVYLFLATGNFNLSIRTAFTGLIIASFAFIAMILFTAYRISAKEENKKQKTIQKKLFDEK